MQTLHRRALICAPITYPSDPAPAKVSWKAAGAGPSTGPLSPLAKEQEEFQDSGIWLVSAPTVAAILGANWITSLALSISFSISPLPYL